MDMKILFLHGLGQNRTAWGETIKLLNCKDVNCIDVIPNNIENQSSINSRVFELLNQ